MKISYLIEAFRLIENASNRRDLEHKILLEKALADIQLFGSAEQIRLVKILTEAFVESNVFVATELLTSLRNDLRDELGLQPTQEQLLLFRFEKDSHREPKPGYKKIVRPPMFQRE